MSKFKKQQVQQKVKCVKCEAEKMVPGIAFHGRFLGNEINMKCSCGSQCFPVFDKIGGGV